MNLALALSIIWAGIIFGASAIPGSNLPEIGTSDTVAHFLVYFIFGILLMWWRIKQLKGVLGASMLQAVILGSVYGITDEFHQYFVPGRTPDPSDWIADTVGVLAGAIVITFGYLIVNRK
ncbi:VanZ family protein [Dissulfuribacter thermophilus]|nr:VanZ family protein [Dissulfuribacter thermophilus]